MNPPATPEEGLARVKACLAEAGYPDAEVDLHVGWSTNYKMGPALKYRTAVPLAVWWQAMATAGYSMPCWACFASNNYDAQLRCCLDADCAHPEGPERPPVELLRRPERSAL